MAEFIEKSEMKKLDFKGLEPLLRKSLGDKDLKVIDFQTSKFLPPGENYCSVIVKLNAKIRRGNGSEEEKLHLVAKTRVENPLIIWSDILKKEVFMYAELMPAYRDLERAVGFEEKDLMDLLPKFMGHRYSITDIDDDSLILLENLKEQGYDSGDRCVGEF